MSVSSTIENNKNIAKKKNKSPNCEIQKTFNAALFVVTLNDQNCIKKKDTILIHSQKKTIKNKSYVKKYKKAN